MNSNTQAPNTDKLEMFAARLKAAMSRKGAVLRNLAAITGKGVSTAGSWTQGKNWPEVETLRALADYLDVSVDFLVSGKIVNSTDKMEGIYHLKTGGLGAVREDPAPGRIPSVASRIPQKRQPSTRAECEAYFAALMEVAENSDNPNAFPAIHDRLVKQFPLSEWPAENPPPDE